MVGSNAFHASKNHFPAPTSMHIRAAIQESLFAGFGSDVRVHQSSVTFTMSGAGFAIHVSGSTFLKVRMDGGLNYFLVSVRDTATNVTIEESVHPPSGLDWIRVAQGLARDRSYIITITKKTEASLRYPWSNFDRVTVRAMRTDGVFHPIDAESVFFPRGWVEVIGDSDACGFGVDGEASSPSNFLTMDPSAQDVHGAWGCLIAELIGLGRISARTVAMSGKGVTSNAPFCGAETIPQIWANLEETRNDFDPNIPPACVCILVGGNDFFDHVGLDKRTFVSAFSNFLSSIRDKRREQAPIFVFQCAASCMSSAGSPRVHPQEDQEAAKACERLCEWTAEAVNQSGGSARSIFYSTIDTPLDVLTDYGIMMHWNRSGQSKIARAMVSAIERHRTESNQDWKWLTFDRHKLEHNS